MQLLGVWGNIVVEIIWFQLGLGSDALIGLVNTRKLLGYDVIAALIASLLTSVLASVLNNWPRPYPSLDLGLMVLALASFNVAVSLSSSV